MTNIKKKKKKKRKQSTTVDLQGCVPNFEFEETVPYRDSSIYPMSFLFMD